MSLKSVNDILGILNLEAIRQEQPFQQLLNCWQEIVGAKVAAHTRPLSIQRHVLWVATSSAAWAQNLTFQRQALLTKLNQKLSQTLPSSLIDIRFSTAEWKKTPLAPTPEPTLSPRKHPSYLGEKIVKSEIPTSQGDVKKAFAVWAEIQQARSQHLPLCPQCQAPTPPGELQRWNVCSPCFAFKSSALSRDVST
jgi:predicted nucleic acid-binding Zn ribbon protein